MTNSLGFVVLAKRPRDWGYEYKVVKMRGRDTGVVFTGPNALEQAQNAQEYCQQRKRREDAESELYAPLDHAPVEPVEYVVGEIVPVQR